LREDGTAVDLFTSEEYDKNKYSQYAGLLSIAQYLVPLGESTNKSYFAITPNFIEHFGRFPKSIIIAMGCSSLNVTGMVQAFLDRGAKAYVGWINVVLPNDTDYETAKFLEMFLGENWTLAKSIAMTNPHNYHDPEKGISVISKMDFYPAWPSIGNLRISDLIAETKDSKASAFSDLQLFSSAIAKVNFKRED
jgi:hypothetical protein